LKNEIENYQNFYKIAKEKKNRNYKKDQIGKTYIWQIRLEGLHW
jgi:hypothetical protein